MLKRKIALARLFAYNKKTNSVSSPDPIRKKIGKVYDSNAESSDSAAFSSKSSALKYKNLTKNYGKAICNFILSEAGSCYLEEILAELNISKPEFLHYIKEKKKDLNGINEFRALLVTEPSDTEQSHRFKAAFQRLGVIFIKYFSVNWIYSSKMLYKLDYVKCRNKLLRRIQNPQSFSF